MRKSVWIAVLTGILMLCFAMTSFAGGWSQNPAGWRWQNADGTYLANAWQWLDGNQDGIAECYCFDESGYMFAGMTTPDGYQVNGDGAWTVDGVVQTKQADAQASEEAAAPAALLYMGQGSIRVVTAEGKVIYIDPFAGDQYDLPADLILVTHGHPDHNQIDLIQNRNADCRIITQEEALLNGEHQFFDLGYVTIEAVEAENERHNINECVGYILTFSNGKSVYVTGDTSTTKQMPELAAREIDYAFFCCDGKFNMGPEEASECAKLVGAKYSIPYHMAPGAPNHFDRAQAERFQAENRIIIEPGQELLVQ